MSSIVRQILGMKIVHDTIRLRAGNASANGSTTPLETSVTRTTFKVAIILRTLGARLKNTLRYFKVVVRIYRRYDLRDLYYPARGKNVIALKLLPTMVPTTHQILATSSDVRDTINENTSVQIRNRAVDLTRYMNDGYINVTKTKDNMRLAKTLTERRVLRYTLGNVTRLDQLAKRFAIDRRNGSTGANRDYLVTIPKTINVLLDLGPTRYARGNDLNLDIATTNLGRLATRAKIANVAMSIARSSKETGQHCDVSYLQPYDRKHDVRDSQDYSVSARVQESRIRVHQGGIVGNLKQQQLLKEHLLLQLLSGLLFELGLGLVDYLEHYYHRACPSRGTCGSHKGGCYNSKDRRALR